MSQVSLTSRVRRRPLDRLWIVVADGATARVVGVTGDRRGLTMLREVTSVAAHRRTHDLVSDRQGRSYESGATARHAIEARHDPHQEARERFVAQLATMLNEDNRARQFDEAILIVAHGMSSQLRDALDAATRARIRQTLIKDLTKEPLPALYEHLVEAGLLPAEPARPA
jgi:protein required for attachment to host cells